MSVSAPLNSNYKFNIIYLVFAKEIGFYIRPPNIDIQKIDNTMLDIYEMIVIVFLISDKVYQVRFFEKIFLIANVSPKIVLRILFHTLNSTNVNFLRQKLRWMTYMT